MTTKVVPGQLITPRETSLVAREAATEIAASLRAAQKTRGIASLALSGGSTPRDAYTLLAKEPDLDWQRVEICWVDERAVPPQDDRSNYRWAKSTLLDVAQVPPARVHRMVAESSDLEAASRDYEQTLRAHVGADASGYPVIDAMVLGIGDDGHTASLFPGEPAVDVTDRLVVAVPAAGKREARMTLTQAVIERARNVFVLVVGTAKRNALERVWDVKGDVHATPARIIRSCKGSLVWIVDRQAAGLDV